MNLFIGICTGFVAGWVLFKRPQWAQSLIDKIKAKFEGL